MASRSSHAIYVPEDMAAVRHPRWRTAAQNTERGRQDLEEQIVMRASDIDVIGVCGYGWPVHRGGPMFWADFAVGLTALHDRMLAYQQTLGGNHWQPAALLHQLTDQGKTFTQYSKPAHIQIPAPFKKGQK